ncbi:hypothetical protein [Streptosporangium sp. NPDC000396]|uniref:hypothetical protein n=1 Tax=Streptosporangium sp. NPDC000396 TaxID=3366185 RepID=UPI0036B57CFD
MRRHPMSCLIALITLAAGCGIQPTDTITAGDPPVAQASSRTNVVFFVKDDKLVKVTRPGLPNVRDLAMQQLLDGPSTAERESGVTSPIGTDSYVTLEITREGDDMMTLTREQPAKGLALLQLVCTADAIPGIKRVKVTNWAGDKVEFHTCKDLAS